MFVPSNAFAPILVTLLPKFNSVKEVHPSKADAPILTILSPIVTDLILVLFLNAPSAMAVTGISPLVATSLTVSGMTIVSDVEEPIPVSV